MRIKYEDTGMENREMREDQEMSVQNNFHRGELTGNGSAGIVSLGLSVSLLLLAVLLASCDSGSKGTDPQGEDSSSSVTVTSSSSGLQTNSSSSTTDPLSSGVVLSSSGTQINSSGSTGNSSSSFVCEEGRIQYLTLAGVRVYFICENNAWVAMPVSSSSAIVVSSSSVAISSSSYYNMDSLFNSELSYGEFTDPRDGQKYRTIVIPDENFEYFAENLNYGKQVSMTKGQTDSTKYCYIDDPWYCENHFGGLYRWSTAMGFPAACDSVKTGSTEACPDTIALPTGYQEPQFFPQHQGICPTGWHVMNEGEWSNIVGGGVGDIVSAVGWNRDNNTLGFSALPGGAAFIDHFDDMGEQAYFWLPQETSATGARVVNLMAGDFDITSLAMIKFYGYSIRCVRDHEGI